MDLKRAMRFLKKKTPSVDLQEQWFSSRPHLFSNGRILPFFHDGRNLNLVCLDTLDQMILETLHTVGEQSHTV